MMFFSIEVKTKTSIRINKFLALSMYHLRCSWKYFMVFGAMILPFCENLGWLFQKYDNNRQKKWFLWFWLVQIWCDLRKHWPRSSSWEVFLKAHQEVLHRFHSINITFENSTEDIMTHFNICCHKRRRRDNNLLSVNRNIYARLLLPI